MSNNVTVTAKGINVSIVNVPGNMVLVSYETPVASFENGVPLQTSMYYSQTTSRHINDFFRGLGVNEENLPHVACMPPSYFAGLIDGSLNSVTNRWFSFVKTGNPFNDWVRHRFASGSYSRLENNDSGITPPDFDNVLNSVRDYERTAITEISISQDLMTRIDMLPYDTAVAVLDGLYSAFVKRHRYPQHRKRVDATIAHIYALGVRPLKFSLIHPPEFPHFIDASRSLGVKETAEAWLMSSTEGVDYVKE